MSSTLQARRDLIALIAPALSPAKVLAAGSTLPASGPHAVVSIVASGGMGEMSGEAYREGRLQVDYWSSSTDEEAFTLSAAAQAVLDPTNHYRLVNERFEAADPNATVKWRRVIHDLIVLH